MDIAFHGAEDDDGLGFDAGFAQFVQVLVVTFGFKSFVAKVFHRLVIEQTIHRPASRLGTAERSGRDRTTLLLSTHDTAGPGALLRLLEPLAEQGISLSRLESRPSRRRKWDYVFFLDLDCHVSDEPVAKALAALKKRASLCKVLGSYPRAVL